MPIQARADYSTPVQWRGEWPRWGEGGGCLHGGTRLIDRRQRGVTIGAAPLLAVAAVRGDTGSTSLSMSACSCQHVHGSMSMSACPWWSTTGATGSCRLSTVYHVWCRRVELFMALGCHGPLCRRGHDLAEGTNLV